MSQRFLQAGVADLVTVLPLASHSAKGSAPEVPSSRERSGRPVPMCVIFAF